MSDQNNEIGSAHSGGANWYFIVIWLFYLIIPIHDLIAGSHSTVRVIGMLAGLGAFCVGYYLAVRLGFPELDSARNRNRYRWFLVGSLALIALALPIVVYDELFVLWIYVSAACGFTLPLNKHKPALWGGIASTLAMLVQGHLLGASEGTLVQLILPCLFTCFGSLGARRTRSLIAQLRTAREEVKQLAVTEERLRMARDLHDLAGHSLATITLKAELARRLIEVDPAAASKQLSDLELVSRQALTDIREAVSGYRRPTLAVELLSARTALSAAEISLKAGLEVASTEGLDPAAEAVLAWCLREATTNVVRHSKAASCTVHLIPASIDGAATLTLEIVDDGLATRDDPECVRDRPYGNGLTGLAERLAAVSGTLTAAPVDPHGFRLSATVPLISTVPLNSTAQPSSPHSDPADLIPPAHPAARLWSAP
jgi:two-component system, NarL family, sensor histidine kinase DesK